MRTLYFPMAGSTTAGFVLAGGRSSRMGRDKSRLPWAGGTLIEHVALKVRGAAGSVVTIGGEPVPGLEHIPDAYPGFGPVGGIATALSATAAEWNLVLACDMPAVTTEFLRSVLAASTRDGVIPVTRDGRMHPLCAIYHQSVAGAMDQAVRSGVHKLIEVVASLDLVEFPVPDESVLKNVNTPREWAEFLALGQE